MSGPLEAIAVVIFVIAAVLGVLALAYLARRTKEILDGLGPDRRALPVLFRYGAKFILLVIPLAASFASLAVSLSSKSFEVVPDVFTIGSGMTAMGGIWCFILLKVLDRNREGEKLDTGRGLAEQSTDE